MLGLLASNSETVVAVWILNRRRGSISVSLGIQAGSPSLSSSNTRTPTIPSDTLPLRQVQNRPRRCRTRARLPSCYARRSRSRARRCSKTRLTTSAGPISRPTTNPFTSAGPCARSPTPSRRILEPRSGGSPLRTGARRPRRMAISNARARALARAG